LTLAYSETVEADDENDAIEVADNFVHQNQDCWGHRGEEYEVIEIESEKRTFQAVIEIGPTKEEDLKLNRKAYPDVFSKTEFHTSTKFEGHKDARNWLTVGMRIQKNAKPNALITGSILADQPPKIGDEVRTIANIDRHPNFLIKTIGLEGTVIEVTNKRISVELIKPLVELETWGNIIDIYFDSGHCFWSEFELI